MFTKLQRRILIVAGGLAVGYAVAFDGIHNRLTPQRQSSPTPFRSRGPYAGRKIDDFWVADAAQSHFSAGKGVVWQMRAELPNDTTVVVETELWCHDHPIQLEEARIKAEMLAAGWQSFGISIPRDATGECHLDRHIETEDEGGSTLQTYDLRRPISLTVDP